MLRIAKSIGVCAGLLLIAPAAHAAGDVPVNIHVTSIVVNGAVRIAAIAAGTYVVWLGRDTFVRGIKGDFEFTGSFGRLRGSAPGLLFVLLGCLAIGWALQAEHSGKIPSGPGTAEKTEAAGSSVPPPPPRVPHTGQTPPPAPARDRP